MADEQLATMWQSLVNKVANDERVTPHLKGHLELAVPKGVLEDTLYIEVPNEITRAMLQQRLKDQLLEIAEAGENAELAAQACPSATTLTGTLHMLSMFCSVMPALVLPVVDLLPEYLRANHGNKATQHVCDMLPRLLPIMNNPASLLIEQFERYLRILVFQVQELIFPRRTAFPISTHGFTISTHRSIPSHIPTHPHVSLYILKKHIPLLPFASFQTSTYLGIPQHTSTYLHIPPHTSTYLHIPPQTSTNLHIPPHTSTNLHKPPQTSTYLHIPPHTSAYLRIPPLPIPQGARVPSSIYRLLSLRMCREVAQSLTAT